MLLKKYRIQNSISVSQLAKSLGISRQHVYEIESGVSFPSRALAVRIEKETRGEVSAEALLFPEKNKGRG